MTYDRISPAVFLDRPNRFVAHILHESEKKLCHVKNTGRCQELLVPGAKILVQKAQDPARKTQYDLVAVYKGNRLINMDSASPNAVFGEFLAAGGLGFTPRLIKPECTHGDSRFDFYFEYAAGSAFAEVKGVTLEENGIARFPDAPTLRGIKHLNGLIQCVREGFAAYAVFIVQMCGIRYFEPNWETHAEFGLALRKAQAAGVKILVYECSVQPSALQVSKPVELNL